MFTTATLLSYSYAPTRKTPVTVKRLMRGNMPAAVTVACGVMTVILSPGATPSFFASSCPNTMPKLPGVNASSLPSTIFLSIIDTCGSTFGSTPMICTTGHLAAEIQHPLPFDVGCGAGNLRIAPRDLFQSAPICQAAFGTDDLRMRRHAQDMVTHIADEAVHYRHHRNQHRRAQGHAQHRGQRDKGNEVIAAFCARIAQADEQLDGTKHGRGLYGADLRDHHPRARYLEKIGCLVL